MIKFEMTMVFALALLTTRKYTICAERNAERTKLEIKLHTSAVVRLVTLSIINVALRNVERIKSALMDIAPAVLEKKNTEESAIKNVERTNTEKTEFANVIKVMLKITDIA